MKVRARSMFACVLCAGLMGAASSALAQVVYPERALRIMVPFPPGGVVDILARDIAQRLNVRWGQPVVVDNRGGANGNIGAELAARAKPDGHTVLITAANIAISVPLYRKLGFDLFKDLVPVSLLAMSPYILVVPPALPVRSVADLVALARKRPGELTLASSGTGSAGHLAGELLQSASGTRLTHVPYKGQAAAMIELIGGQVTTFFATVAVVNPHLHDGRIRVLAVTTPRRSSILPAIPTIAESGFPGFEITAWHGVFLQAGTRPDVVAKLNEELVRFLRLPESVRSYNAQGLELVGSTPEAFGVFLRSEVATYEKAIRSANVRVE